MNLNTSTLFNDLPLQGLQSKGLENDVIGQAGKSNAPEFSKMLQQAIDNVNGLQQQTGDLRNRFEMGDEQVSLGDVMIASNKSSLAFEATVEVRNKVVEAYKSVMSMPV